MPAIFHEARALHVSSRFIIVSLFRQLAPLLTHNNEDPCQSISYVEKDTVCPANNAPDIKWINLMGTLGIRNSERKEGKLDYYDCYR